MPDMHTTHTPSTAISVAMVQLEQKCESLNSDVVDLRDKYRMEVVQRRLLYNKVQELKGNIRVFCRCRKVGMVWYGMVWYGMVWNGMEWNDMVWYGMVWYGIFLINIEMSAVN